MAKNTKHKHIKQQKEAAAGERIIHISRNVKICFQLFWLCVLYLRRFKYVDIAIFIICGDLHL